MPTGSHSVACHSHASPSKKYLSPSATQSAAIQQVLVFVHNGAFNLSVNFASHDIVALICGREFFLIVQYQLIKEQLQVGRLGLLPFLRHTVDKRQPRRN